MPQFDVYLMQQGVAPYIVDVQTDLLKDLKTRVVVPLFPLERYGAVEFMQLKPIITLNDTQYIFDVADIGPVPLAILSAPVTNISHMRYELFNAIDFLLQGY